MVGANNPRIVPTDTGEDLPTPETSLDQLRFFLPYRAWAKARHNQLCAQWTSAWQSKQSFGTKKGSAAEILVLRACLDAARLQAQDKQVAGASYDMAKCFDSIPEHIAIEAMRARGADKKVLRAIQGFYGRHRKHFQLDGCFAEPFKPTNASSKVVLYLC